MKKLNLGCGGRPIAGYVNLDVNGSLGADVCHDLNRYPYPFADGEFDEVRCEHVLEHLDDIVKPLEEIWRICRPGAVVRIVVPVFPGVGAIVDPTHKCFYSYGVFDYFTARAAVGHYTKARYEIEERRLVFSYSLPPMKWANGLLNRLVNASPRLQRAYFYNFSFTFPAYLLTATLRAVKG